MLFSEEKYNSSHGPLKSINNISEILNPLDGDSFQSHQDIRTPKIRRPTQLISMANSRRANLVKQLDNIVASE